MVNKEWDDENLSIIENSLFKAWRKCPDKSLVVDKTNLVFKIVDNLAVPKQKAMEYLMILQSRKLIEVDRTFVTFTPSRENIKEKEMDEYFDSLKKNVATN